MMVGFKDWRKRHFKLISLKYSVGSGRRGGDQSRGGGARRRGKRHGGHNVDRSRAAGDLEAGCARAKCGRADFECVGSMRPGPGKLQAWSDDIGIGTGMSGILQSLAWGMVGQAWG
jgi:hypothetical protein